MFLDNGWVHPKAIDLFVVRARFGAALGNSGKSGVGQLFTRKTLHVRVYTNAGSEAGRTYKRASQAAVALRGWGFGDLPMIASEPESIQHPSPITRRL